MENTLEQSNFNNLVTAFLAEALRSRRTSLPRAAEISQRVVANIKNCKNESDTLSMLTDIEKDFEEVKSLKQAVHFGYKEGDLKVFENEIKEYASSILSEDISLSAGFLKDAAMPDMTIQGLCIKHPKFFDFLLKTSDKAKLLPDLVKSPQ